MMDKYFLVSLILLIVKAADADVASNSKDDSSSNSSASNRSPYLTSQSVFVSNYQTMIRELKIFAYPHPNHPSSSPPSSISLFHSSLLKSPFLTSDGEQAHLFYLPISSSSSSSSKITARIIRDLRCRYPYWNRTLGADHFYVYASSTAAAGKVKYESNRNMVELQKNSVQITPNSNNLNEGGKFFVPHKDIILPAAAAAPPLGLAPTAAAAAAADAGGAKFLILVKGASDEKRAAGFLSELSADPDFQLLHDENTIGTRLNLPSFRLFIMMHGDGTGDHPLSEIGEALQSGWLPLILIDRPVLDLPFADVLKWSEIAVFVQGGAKEMMKKRLLSLLLTTTDASGSAESSYQRMRALGKTAARHFVWNPPPLLPLSSSAYDAFHTVLYQLWLRRHVVRYISI